MKAAIHARGACHYRNRRIDLELNDPAPTVRLHMVVRGLLIRRKRHREDWPKTVDSRQRVVCPGSGQIPKLRRDSGSSVLA